MQWYSQISHVLRWIQSAVLELRSAQTYASYIDQPCMRLFLSLSAVTVLVLMGADYTDAYANAPSPTQPTYVRIDDAYVDWFRSRHGKEVDHSLMLPVLKVTVRWYYQCSRPCRDTPKRLLSIPFKLLRIPCDLRSTTFPIESIKPCTTVGSEQATVMSSTCQHRMTTFPSIVPR
jgi:hypothetical protein